MPTVQFFHNGRTFTKNMITPKRITKLEAWYKEARKVITDIPEALMGIFGNNEWMIEHHEVDVKWIKFDLLHTNGFKAYIVILR
jgi:hypothetical protein